MRWHEVGAKKERAEVWGFPSLAGIVEGKTQIAALAQADLRGELDCFEAGGFAEMRHYRGEQLLIRPAGEIVVIGFGGEGGIAVLKARQHAHLSFNIFAPALGGAADFTFDFIGKAGAERGNLRDAQAGQFAQRSGRQAIRNGEMARF